jgi:Domain of unknown function DUF29
MATQIEQPQLVEAPSYDQDFYLWCYRMAELIRAGRFEEVDRENVAEEIESLGRRYLTELRSRTISLLVHLLKRDYQREKHSQSWLNTIDDQRLRTRINIRKNPSLKRKLPTLIQDHYDDAVAKAMRETGLARNAFPSTCPYTVVEVYGEWMEQ